ncbi:MAG TPA: hypothetical protein PKM36_06630 [Propionibacteriaceae bacterium]|nr:hypothetical protein [Propionibacteriaceae bacterium]HPZ48520.1 hypothetical protein [Propionibacteriaceae bacterium]HQE31247.1 hypothetical protein [Propionibacteriaceae bacterium]
MDPDVVGEGRLLALLGVRLDQLMARRIPVRGVSAGPVLHSTRLRFADGTTLLVRSERSGNMARVLQAVLSGRPVLVERWERRSGGLALALAVQSSGRRLHLGMVVLGPDQPD